MLPSYESFSILEGQKTSDRAGQWKFVISIGRADLELLDIIDLYSVDKQLYGILHPVRTGNHDALSGHVDEEVPESFVNLGLGVTFEVLSRLQLIPEHLGSHCGKDAHFDEFRKGIGLISKEIWPCSITYLQVFNA